MNIINVRSVLNLVLMKGITGALVITAPASKELIKTRKENVIARTTLRSLAQKISRVKQNVSEMKDTT